MHVDAHLVPGFSHRAFQRITQAELASQFTRVQSSPFTAAGNGTRRHVNPFNLQSFVVISSVIPSLKYTLSASVFRFFNGSTATDGLTPTAAASCAECF